MNENQKAQQYDRYMYEYDKLSNQVSLIKSENFELNDSQRFRIQELEKRMRFIMESASRL
jgi:hypothetical protein